ncbi:anaerobic sulfatase maturase [Alistipes sp.]|uniref:anaerobic sulfatase maturase n=1 Tax=Alistipes sp. TaxID=1872444 RepID=UPI003AF1C68F
MKKKDIFTFRDAEKQAGPAAFSTMLKPAGSSCNLDCRYCYYLDKAVQYGGRQAVMSDQLLELYIKQYIEANEVPVVQFCWHGGEPLLLGVEFYRRAMDLQRKYAAGKRIENTLQTNGTLVDEAWCELFAANNFLVGLSLDGPEELHDAFRLSKGGERTFGRVMRSVELFRECGVEFNTLSVVSRLSEGRGAAVYRFFRDEVRSRYMQFLPAVEHVVEKPGFRRPLIVSPETPGAQRAEWSVTAAGYGRFLCDVFDEWVVADVGRTFVQLFDATLAQWCGVEPGVCSMGETCGDALVVEHNGDVYSCDHFVYPEYKLGNIRETPLAEIYRSARRRQFGLDKRNTLPRECLGCKYYFACRGECPKHRFDRGSDGGPKNTLCEGLKHYFHHVEPCMDHMRDLLARRQPPAWVMPFARRRMGLE